MREYIIKIWEDEVMRDLGESDVVAIGLTDMDDAIRKAKHVMGLRNCASLEVQTQDEKTTVFAITPEDGEQYFYKEVADIKLQDKINKYFKVVYPGNILQVDDVQLFGKVKDVIKDLKENQEYASNPENEVDEEYKEEINNEIKELLKDLEKKDNSDIVRLFEGSMGDFYRICDMKETLKEIQEKYFKKMEDLSLENKNIADIIEIYFDMNDIDNLMDYGADNETDNMKSLSNLFKDILKELEIPTDEVFTREGFGDGKYEVTIVFENGKESGIDIKAWNTSKEVARNIEDVVSRYQALEQTSPELE